MNKLERCWIFLTWEGKEELGNFPRQQAEQKEECILFMFGMLQVDIIFLATDCAGWLNLLCHNLNTFDEFWHVLKKQQSN